ncbi:hypothetical protein GcM1_174018 [Golovinomyces cichoracearum]|uniref:Uncharacterized protein n=1 Tax=Golovinomyces cichoracearum TaxID=62708 RepID=A0A420J5V3_9PEZI|nr:hypothetical protein GcM1_174018 [Golovinomyces cichoracearum]
MGANLSSNIVVDTSADVISPGDLRSDITLLFITAGALYAIGMILGTTQLIDHWRGPNGERQIDFSVVLMAILLSSAWPVILFYVWFLVP